MKQYKKGNKEMQVKYQFLKKNRVSWLVCVTIIFIIFFIINYLTPPLADDFAYRNYGESFHDNKIDALNGFLRSVMGFYKLWGGRIAGYVFMVIFNAMPPVLFDLLNSACYILFVYLVYKISNFGRKPSLKLFLFVNILIWLFVPDYGQVMFWTSGSANYLYPAVIDLIVLLLCRKYSSKKGSCFQSILWFLPAWLLGILAGCGMENISAGMLVVLTLNMVFFAKNKIASNPMMIGLYTGALMGYGILLFAPGNAARAQSDGEKYHLGYLFKCFIAGYYWIFFGLGIFAVIGILLLLKYRKIIEIEREEQLQSCFYYIASVLSAGCLIFAPTIAERAWFISTVYGVAAAGILFAAAEEAAKNRKIISDISLIIIACGCIFCFVSAADTAICSYEVHTQFMKREDYILEQKNSGNMDVSVPVISYKYPFRSKHDAFSGLGDIKEEQTYWMNQALADYYGLNSITGIEGMD